MSDDGDLELIEACAEGDDAAWETFFRRYGSFLDYVVRRALSGGGRVVDAHAVAEVRDEVVLWLLANDGRVLRTYRGESKVTSWLGVVAGRRARRIARKGAGLRNKTVSLDALSAEATTHLALDPVDDSPRQAALLKLGEAIEALSDRDRLLLKGAFYEKRSYADLADELGVRTDSVGQLLFRAKKRLAKRLGGKDFLLTMSGCVMACLLWLLERSGA